MNTKHLQALQTTLCNLEMQKINVQVEIMEALRDLATTDSGQLQETLVIDKEIYYKGVDY